MKRLLGGIAVALAMGTFVLVGCSGGTETSAANTGVAEGGHAGGKAPAGVEQKAVHMTDAQLQRIINTVPESDWDKLPNAQQVRDYAKTHQKTAK